MEQLKLSNQICHRYYVASNAISRAYKPFLDKLGLTYPQYLVLLALWENDEVEVNHLKAVTQIDGGALTLILKKLVAKDVLLVNPSDADKRVKIVSLTPNGHALKLAAAEIPAKLMCKVPDLTPEELHQIKTLTDKIIHNLLAQE